MSTIPANKTVIGLGEVLWDCFPQGRRPGGAPSNFAFQAGQLGLQAYICSRVGQDPAGDELVQYLDERGLSTEYIQRDPRHPTGTVTVHADEASSPEYTIHEHVAWDFLELDPRWDALFEHAAAVCFGTLAQRHSASRRTIQQALERAGGLVVYDVNLRAPFYQRDWIEASLSHADIVKLNVHEAATLSDLFGLETHCSEGFAEFVGASFGIRHVCVTRGADGCSVFSAGERADVPSRPVCVVDAVGAGDAFTAGLVHGVLARWSLEKSARFANEVGGLVAASAGAMPELRESLSALRESFTAS